MKTPEEYINENLKGMQEFMPHNIYSFYCGVINEMMIAYAHEACKETQRRCAENAKVIVEKTKLPQTGYLPSKRFNMKGVVDKSSILDPENLAI